MSLAEEILRSAKYHTLAPQLVHSIAEQAQHAHAKPALAEQYAKAKLHQIGTAYFRSVIPYARLLQSLQATTNLPERIALSEQILRLHASTAERLPYYPAFWETIFSHLPPLTTITDIACGLNPLALAAHFPNAHWQIRASDIFADMMDFLQVAVPLLGVSIHTACQDALQAPPVHPQEVVLLLKALPCFEQISPTATQALLASIQTRHWVISYPLRSLGGKKKGMDKNYRQQFAVLAERMNWQAQELVVGDELVYIVNCELRLSP
jgi:16S rRNA (guanine(1405)-N(7))-methyltransferase